MFSPVRVELSTLAPIGYTNHVPSIRARVAVFGHHDLPIVAVMLSKRIAITKTSLVNIAASRMRIVPAKLKLGKTPAWRAHNAIFKGLVDPNILQSVVSNAPMQTASTPVFSSFKLACPKGKVCKEVVDRTLIKMGRWAVISCSRCKAPSKASRWLCECDRIWYTCTTHACIGSAFRSAKRSGIAFRWSNKGPCLARSPSVNPSGSALL